MASYKKSQHKSSKKHLTFGQMVNDNSGSEYVESSGSDWEKPKAYRKKTKKLWTPSQDLAQDAGEVRRNIKSEKDGGAVGGEASSGGGKRKKKKKKRQRGSLGKREAKEKEDEEPRQCHWMDCVNAARKGSKYCSDECGVKLAELRILMILPDRLTDWKSSPCVAEQKNKEKLEKTEEQRKKYRDQFDELDEKRQELDKFIEQVSGIPYDIEKDNSDETGGLEEGMASCVVCGHDTNAKTYIKHIERCFVRTEKRMDFEAKTHPSFIPGTKLLCDYYNKKNGKYCKRLDVSCPDHSRKTPIIPKDVVCGSPLSPNYELDLNNICLSLKSACNRHYNWEKYRRAEIDIQKVVAWEYLEDILKKQEELTREMTNRLGLLDLLLNSTKAAGGDQEDEDVKVD